MSNVLYVLIQRHDDSKELSVHLEFGAPISPKHFDSLVGVLRREMQAPAGPLHNLRYEVKQDQGQVKITADPSSTIQAGQILVATLARELNVAAEVVALPFENMLVRIKWSHESDRALCMVWLPPLLSRYAAGVMVGYLMLCVQVEAAVSRTFSKASFELADAPEPNSPDAAMVSLAITKQSGTCYRDLSINVAAFEAALCVWSRALGITLQYEDDKSTPNEPVDLSNARLLPEYHKGSSIGDYCF